MASAAVIQEFLVSIGYKVDTGSQQQFNRGLAEAGKNAEAVQGSVSKASGALQQFGQHLKTASDEPARKFADGARRISAGMLSMSKGVIELGRNALATGGAFAAGIIQVSKNFEELYYIAQRTGATISQISALRATAEGTGKGADELAAGLERLQAKISEGGTGIKNYASYLAGIDFDKTADKTEFYLTLVEKLSAEWATAGHQAATVDRAAQVGVSEAVLRAGGARRADGLIQAEYDRKLNEENKKRIAAAGVDMDALGAQATKLRETMTAIGTNFGLIWAQAAVKSMPAIKSILDGVDSLIVKVKLYNTTHPDAAQAETFAAIAAGVLALEGAFKLLTGRALLFNPLVAAGAGAAYLVISHWEDVVKWFETGGKRIFDAFQRGDWKEGFAEIGRQGAQALQWGWEQIQLGATMLSDLLKQALGVKDWEEGWRKIGYLAGRALEAAWEEYVQFSKWIAPKIDEITKYIQTIDLGVWGTALSKRLGEAFAPISPEQADKVVKDPMLAALDRLVAAAGQKAKDFVTSFFTEAWKDFTEKSNFGPLGKLFSLPGKAREALGFSNEQEDLRKKRPIWESAPANPEAEEGSYQGGGIVKINAHEGEMVLPVPISRGLQALFRASSQPQEPQAPAAARGLQKLGEWLTGIAGAIPRVMVTNWDDLIREQEEVKIGAPNKGEYGPPAPGSPNLPAAGGGGGAEPVGGATGDRGANLERLEKIIYELETSSGKDVTVSSAGARGPMQMMPETFKQYAAPGMGDIDNPEHNKAAARRLIAELYDKFQGDFDKVLEGYNRGAGKVGTPRPAGGEAEKYLEKAHALMRADAPRTAAGGEELPEGGGKVTPGAKGANVDLHTAMTKAFQSILPPGYTAEVISGARPGGSEGSQHFRGNAEDWQIKGPGGREIRNRGEDTTGLYQKAAVAALAYLTKNNPALAKRFGWGGHFGTQLGGGGEADLMHYDLGGIRGRIGDPTAERKMLPAYMARMKSASDQLDRIADTRLVPGGAGIPGPEAAAEGDKTTTVNVTNNTTIHGDGDPRDTERRYNQSNRRLHADLIRNLKPVIA